MPPAHADRCDGCAENKVKGPCQASESGQHDHFTDTQPISVKPTATAASGASACRRSVIAAAMSGATPIRPKRMIPGTRKEGNGDPASSLTGIPSR